MRLRVLSAIYLFWIVWATLAHAGQATFGSEFTFSNPITLKAESAAVEANKSQRDKMAAVIKEICKKRGDCKVTRSPRKWMIGWDYVVTYEDGWSWRISTDPRVVETQTAPATYEQLRSYSSRIQDDLFGSAAKAGMFPGAEGGGHIHIGASTAFGNNPSLFRNFLVDQVNHAELALGIFNVDLWNSAPIASLKAEQIDEFRKVIDEFDQGKIRAAPDLARAIQDRVYYRTWGEEWTPTEKYQAINLTRIVGYEFDPDRQTVEMRAFKPQKNFDEFLRQALLFQARIDFLEKQKGRIAMRERLGPMSFGDRSEAFYQFVTESGLDWKDYREFAPELRPSEGAVFPKYAAVILPHTERTEADFAGLHKPMNRVCSGVLRQLFKLRPKNLLFFGY